MNPIWTVSGLGRGAFEVFEDGAPQTITQFTNERVPLGHDTVALGCQGIPRGRSRITLAPGGQEQRPQHRGILRKSLRRFAAAAHRPRVYAAAVGLGICLAFSMREKSRPANSAANCTAESRMVP